LTSEQLFVIMDTILQGIEVGIMENIDIVRLAERIAKLTPAKLIKLINHLDSLDMPDSLELTFALAEASE